jgi:hypothetical protein
VEVLNGDVVLGAARPITNQTIRADAPYILPSEQWIYIWSNAPAGTHVLRARAEDTTGTAGTSAPVKITLVTAPPPPTNYPAMVSIFAKDPVAIEGTNCWVRPAITNRFLCWSNWTASYVGWVTNCGPKNATFVVRRGGSTNSALAVRYLVGGTASNGVDYLELNGEVTVPAGERTALITIVPLEDEILEPKESVRLKLVPSDVPESQYLIGWPSAAAGMIVESQRPRPISGLLADKCFHLNAAGPDGAWFRVEYSTNMLHWIPLCTNQVVQGSIDFVDPDASAEQKRFYRAVKEESVPLELP